MHSGRGGRLQCRRLRWVVKGGRLLVGASSKAGGKNDRIENVATSLLPCRGKRMGVKGDDALRLLLLPWVHRAVLRVFETEDFVLRILAVRSGRHQRRCRNEARCWNMEEYLLYSCGCR